MMLFRLLLLISAVTVLAAPAVGQRLLWRIGEFNQSSGEFRSHDVDYNDPKVDPVFRVGQSDPRRDWLRFQPGPANGMAGGRLHPFTIVFDHAGTPRGTYHLKLAVMYETPRLSSLQIEVNGKAGRFYFHPELDYGGGDWEGTFVPQTSIATKTVAIAAEWLRTGENRIVLTAIDEPADSEKILGSIAPGHTGIVYDALELTQSDQRYDTGNIEVTAVPTVFYRGEAGSLKQIVDVYANFASMPQAGSVELRVSGAPVRQEFKSAATFGELRWALEVPEWSGTARAQIVVEAAGRARRFPLQLTAGKKWTVFVVPHEHLDIGFTDYPGKVAELHSQAIDDATKAMERTPDFRWTLDGVWVADQYLAGRSPEKQKEFLENLRRERIVLPLQYSNQHTGTASLEGLARSLYAGHQFATKHGIPVRYAHDVDVPSYTWSYASVLKEAGVRYFLGASNNWRAPMLLHGRWNERSPFYWEGPDGSRVLMWYSRAYLQLHTMFGGPPRVEAARDSLPVFLQAYSRPEYRSNSTILFGSQLENTTFSKEQAEFIREWQKHYAYPRLQYASVPEAMAVIDKDFDGEFPVVRGDLGPYWEDGFGSDAQPTAEHRQNQYRILTAEKLSTIPNLLDGAVRPDASLLENAWRNSILFDEHTWTFVGATTQPEHEQTSTQTALKRARVTEARRQIIETIHRSWAQLQAFISVQEASLVVFNPLNWARGGTLTYDLPAGAQLVDTASNRPVPYEVVHVGRGTQLPGFGPGYRRIRFFVSDVPGLGYKVLKIKNTTESDPKTQVAASSMMENQFYRVTLDQGSGAIKSVFDKQLNRELVDGSSPYRFASYLYVTGADDMPNNSLYRYGAGLPPPKLTVHPAAQGKVVEIRKSPLGSVAVLESSAPNTPRIRTEVHLLDAEKKIEVRIALRKDKVLTKEAAYIAFPFAAEQPTFSFGNQTGSVDPAKDRVFGGSLEWHTVTHGMSVSGGGFTGTVVPLDAPLATFGDIVRGLWPTKFEPRSSTMFSWLMNNYWGTNFVPWQGGDFEFRYVIFSDAVAQPQELARRGWSSLTPLEADMILPTFAAGRLPATQAQLLAVAAPNVVVNTWKLAEDGRGSVVRLQETAGRAGTVRLGSEHLRIQQAWRTSLLEENREELPVANGSAEVQVKPFEIITVRLATVPATAATTPQQRSER